MAVEERVQVGTVVAAWVAAVEVAVVWEAGTLEVVERVVVVMVAVA